MSKGTTSESDSTSTRCHTRVVGSQDVAADLWTGPSSSLQSSLRRYSEPGEKHQHTAGVRVKPSVCSCDIMWQFSTFVDEETGVDEQPVAILLCGLQRQSRCQLILQEGQRHALLQVVRGGGQAGCQTTSTAGTRETFYVYFIKPDSGDTGGEKEDSSLTRTSGCVPAWQPAALRT